MIHIIIFSFNRALQLEALLSSIQCHWQKTNYTLSVLYNTSGDDFQKGYDILQKEYPAYEFIKETRKTSGYHVSDYMTPYNLKKLLKYHHIRKQKSNFRDLLNNMLATSSCEYTLYLTDDSAFIRDVELSKNDLAFIEQNPDINQISLRLGKNITERPASIPVNNGKLEWDFHNHRAARSWGYNFSVDAHIYSTKLCLKMQSKIIYANPTTLEANIVHYVMPRNLMDHGLTYEYPFILSFPINMVQEIADNESMGISIEDLNNYYLEGKRLEYIVPDEILEFQQYPETVYLCKNGQKELLKLK